MTMLRATHAIALGLLGTVCLATMADAQLPLPAAKPPDGATLFRQQCATCHTSNETDPIRQGPPLFKVIGRRAGSVEGFKYSPGFAEADVVWDESSIDKWITNPQAMISSAVMAYRQPKPEIRAAIISYLKELK